MIRDDSSNAAATYLQTANTVSSGIPVSSAAPPEEGAVLEAVASPGVVDVPSLARELSCAEGTLSPLIASLTERNLIHQDSKNIWLTAIGQRAVRYGKMAKF
jgi:hypothetical protein